MIYFIFTRAICYFACHSFTIHNPSHVKHYVVNGYFSVIIRTNAAKQHGSLWMQLECWGHCIFSVYTLVHFAVKLATLKNLKLLVVSGFWKWVVVRGNGNFVIHAVHCWICDCACIMQISFSKMYYCTIWA